MEYLVFRLYGPMASWGTPAVGETRPTATHPGRGAVLGLLAAAVGVKREDETRLDGLSESVVVAVKQTSPGVLLRDYHTAQVPGQDKKAWRMTRRDELAAPKHKLHTILSARDYRCDGYWCVAIRLTENGHWQLKTLIDALRKPRFPLYLGRKSCPLAAPLAPQLIEAAGVREALDSRVESLTQQGFERDARLIGARCDVAYAWEGEGGDIEAQQTRYPSDRPISRSRWQFTTRPEYWHQLPKE